ncbi:hypothetical protein L1987_62074 [Smallanthus sonchifolius]|uniref:Uncharacterized protein n=1 Tax=Smallanthus sonchifolius TaxID=185202 RepID=A0ACB9C9D5_9ASTR|nr:hypothetical protein L1987_62074 [Smallanthus sonchifolius]
METQSLRIRLMFEDRLVSQQQRSEGMNHTRILIEPNQYPKISDVCSNLLHKFNLRSSCPNGILLFMEGFMLPPSESTRILKDNDIICLRRNGIALAEAIEGADACSLLDEEVNRRELVDNRMLLLENEEFDKETGGYQRESEDAVVVKVEEPSPTETTSKKRKAFTKLLSSKKKKHQLEVRGDDEVVTNEIDKVNNYESLLLQKKTSNKKIKPNEVKKENAESLDKNVKNIKDNVVGVKQTSTAPDEAKKVPSRSARRKKAKRRWRQEHAKISHNPDTHDYTNELDQANNDESLPQKKVIKKKIKLNEEIKKENAETNGEIIKDNVEGVKQTSTAPDGAKKVPSRSTRRKKAKRRWRQELAKISQNPDAHQIAARCPKNISKKKMTPNVEIKKEYDETSDYNIKDYFKGVEQMTTSPDAAKKVPSRSAIRKNTKRRWRQEFAKISQNPDNHEYTNEIDQAGNDESLPQEKISTKKMKPNKEIKKEIAETSDKNIDDNVEGVEQTSTAPDGAKKIPSRNARRKKAKKRWRRELAKNSQDIAFQWNGITNEKQGQKRGLEKFSTFERDDPQKETKESSTMLTLDTQVPLVDLIDFDQLPLCNSPKAGDVIAYRVLELSSSWTPELSSFRVGKVSYYDANNIVLMPVPEYPIVFDMMDEDGFDNSLYKEDASLEIKFAALADVRSVKQSNSDAVKAVSNGVDQTPQGDEKTAASNLMSNSNSDKENLSKDPSPVVDNKEGNAWGDIDEILQAKKSELLEMNQGMEKESGWNKWSYRALRGALGPTVTLLRSSNNM